MKISIILPAKDEEKIIAGTITDIQAYLRSKKYDYEIIVIVNGCTDNTQEIAENLALKDRKIQVLKSEAGYGFALRKGLKNAKGNYMVIYNVDFFDLRFIDLCLVDLLGRDLIIGSKTVSWAEDKRWLSRKMVSKFFNLFLKLATGFKGTDTHGIKVVRYNAVKKILPQCKTDSGIFDTEFVLRVQYAGFKIADFPVTIKEIRPSRFGLSLTGNLRDIWKLLKALKK